jgi:hypothetical protein
LTGSIGFAQPMYTHRNNTNHKPHGGSHGSRKKKLVGEKILNCVYILTENIGIYKMHNYNDKKNKK